MTNPDQVAFASTVSGSAGLHVSVGGVQRTLRSVAVGQAGRVPLVEFLGDSELSKAAARELLSLLHPETTALLAAVTNAVPLVHELSDLSGLPYVVARKKRRTYMQNPLIQEVAGLSLGVSETLWLDGPHAERLRHQRVTVVQDVFASGATAQALTRLTERAGGEVVGYLAAFQRGEADFPVKVLQKLPALL